MHGLYLCELREVLLTAGLRLKNSDNARKGFPLVGAMGRPLAFDFAMLFSAGGVDASDNSAAFGDDRNSP
jgi:hypothetical protein